jgi:hypothetical protein
MAIRVDRYLNLQKLIGPVVKTDAYTHKEQLLFYDFSKF